MQSDRRLHPLSILFALGAQLRALLIPLIVVVFLSRQQESGFIYWAPAFVAITAIGALVRYLSFRYRYDEGEMVIRTGIFFRNERHIPYARIQNIDAVQNLLHRAFGVAEVRVETGGGSQAEATLSVLPMAALDEMRERVFARRTVAPVPDQGETAVAVEADAAAAVETVTTVAAEPEVRTVLHLSPGQLMLAGFIENRGMVLILAAVGLLYELAPSDEFISSIVGREIEGGGPFSSFVRGAVGSGVALETLLFFVALLLILLLVVRMVSVVWAVVRLYDFTLTRRGDDLRTEYGLFTRVSATIPLRRVQSVTIREGLLHRMFDRASVRVTTAGGTGQQDGGRSEREWLAPILHRSELQRILHEVQPEISLETLEWHPVHHRAFARAVKVALGFTLLVSLGLAVVLRWWSVAAIVPLLVLAALAARTYVRHLGWALASDVVAFRTGWLWRYASFARFSKIQVVSMRETPFDRRTGMASVNVDTAGAGSAFRVHVPYLARETADELRAFLAARAASTAFRW